MNLLLYEFTHIQQIQLLCRTLTTTNFGTKGSARETEFLNEFPELVL